MCIASTGAAPLERSCAVGVCRAPEWRSCHRAVVQRHALRTVVTPPRFFVRSRQMPSRWCMLRAQCVFHRDCMSSVCSIGRASRRRATSPTRISMRQLTGNNETVGTSQHRAKRCAQRWLVWLTVGQAATVQRRGGTAHRRLASREHKRARRQTTAATRPDANAKRSETSLPAGEATAP